MTVLSSESTVSSSASNSRRRNSSLSLFAILRGTNIISVRHHRRCDMRHCGAQFPETQTRNEMTAELRGDQRLELQYPLPGYLLDIKELFQSWCEGQPTSFKAFKDIWARKEMSYIFSCRPSHFEPSEWLDNLVEAAWGMAFIKDFRGKIGVLYCLYLLHQTQPLPASRIRTSIALWNEMGKVKERAKELGIWDAVAVYRDLARGNALQFCALVRAVPPPTVLRPPPLPSRKEEKVMANVDTLSGASDMEDVQLAFMKYNELAKDSLKSAQIINADFMTGIQEILRKGREESVRTHEGPMNSYGVGGARMSAQSSNSQSQQSAEDDDSMMDVDKSPYGNDNAYDDEDDDEAFSFAQALPGSPAADNSPIVDVDELF